MTTARPRPGAIAALVAACWASGATGQELRLDSDFASAREAMDPVRWLLAQAPAPGAASRASSQAIFASPAATTASPSWAARILPFIDSGEPAGFAPARWGGRISLDYVDQRGEEGLRRHVSTATASLNAASYFWQPWFAQVRGTLTVLAAAESGSGGASATAAESNLRGLSLSGGGTLTVFPASRFPFLASLDSTDSRASGEFSPSDYRNTRASLRQTWRDPLGETTYAGGLDYSLLDSASFGRDSVLQLDSRYLGARAPHRIDAALAWSRNRRDSGSEGSDILRAFGTHLYTPTPDLWVNSLASFTETELGPGAGGLAFTQRLGQLTSQAVWRPEFDDRLVLTGGGRLFVNQFSRSGPDSTSHSLSGNAGATFSIDDQASLNASMSATQVAVTGGEDALVTVGSAGANYVSRPLDLGFANYSVSASLQGGRQSGGPEESRIVASAQADQQLARALALGDAVSLNLLATQGGGVTHDSFLGRTDTLRLGASAGVRVATSEASDAYLGASYAQSESKGGVNDRFRLANVQASGQVRFGPYDSLSANVTAQWVRGRRDLLPDAEDATRQVYGGLSYQHSRLFGVPRLRYLLSATFNEGVQTASRLLGDLDATRENVTQLIDHRLLYDIGRLELRLGMRFAKIDGRDDLQWYLRVHRQIGQY